MVEDLSIIHYESLSVTPRRPSLSVLREVLGLHVYPHNLRRCLIDYELYFIIGLLIMDYDLLIMGCEHPRRGVASLAY